MLLVISQKQTLSCDNQVFKAFLANKPKQKLYKQCQNKSTKTAKHGPPQSRLSLWWQAGYDTVALLLHAEIK